MAIAGGIDTAVLDRGFDRVKAGLEGVKGHAAGTTADLTRMEAAASGVAKKLTLLGALGSGAFIALASRAPAVAPALAKIAVIMDKLSRAAGRILAPAFEVVAGALEGLTSWVESNEGRLRSLIGVFAEMGGMVIVAATTISGFLKPKLDELMKLVGVHNIDFGVNIDVDRLLLGGLLMAYGVTGHPVALTIGAAIVAHTAATAAYEAGATLTETNPQAPDYFFGPTVGGPTVRGEGPLVDAWNFVTSGGGWLIDQINRKDQQTNGVDAS